MKTPTLSLLLRPRLCTTSRAPYICRSCIRQLQTPHRSFTSGKPRKASLGNSVKQINRKQPEIYDIVCVGGGPAGLSLCAALRSSPFTRNLRIALIDSQSLQKSKEWNLPPNSWSNRCSSLTPSSVHFLEDIGAWKHVDGTRVQSYSAMRVWDGVTGSRISFNIDGDKNEGGEVVAYMNENTNLVRGLLRRIEELGGVDIFEGKKVDGIEYGLDDGVTDLTGWPVVKIEGKEIASRLLVGADGGNSPVRAWAGIESRGWEYGAHGVVATLQLDPESVGNEVAYQRFLPTGPVAFLPLPGNFATLVWSTTPSNAALLKSLSPKDFTAMVNAAFRLSPTDLQFLHSIKEGHEDEFNWRSSITQKSKTSEELPRIVLGVQEGSVASFPLKMKHADTYIGERIALIGDAAHSIHPLAGQGLNMGQGDVESLMKCIETTVLAGGDIGVKLNLEDYAGERWGKNAVLMGVCDGLNRGFGVGSGPVVAVRSWGLDAFERLGGVKKWIMEQASGKGRGMKFL